LRLQRLKIADILTGIFLIGLCLLILIPFIWMLSTSLKESVEVFRIPIQWIPRSPQWQNYPRGLARRNFGRYFFNSTVVAITVTTTTLFFASLAGFGLAKYDFFGRNAIFIGILSTLMIPFQVIMIPVFLLVRDLGWLDSYVGLMVPQALTAFGVFLVRQYMITLPDSLLDAARIDGASEPGIFFRIALPLCKPVLSVLAIFTFRSSWDSLLWPLIVVSTDRLRTLPLGLSMFITDYDIEEHWMMAVAVSASLPVFILFMLAQKHFTEGIAISGMKG
jgi:multiple sugar transport system permease protein